MVNVTIDLLYHELMQVHKELHELRARLEPEIPVEKVSVSELEEIDSALAEMRRGKATPWRELLKK